MNIRAIGVLLFCMAATPALTQEGNFRLGTLPSLNINKKLSNGFKANMKGESRQVLYRDNDITPSYDRTDLSLIISKRVGLSAIMAGGYMMRFDDGAVIHRFIQQYTRVNNGRIRMSHRFVFDQTLAKTTPTQYRLRYRIAGLFPFSGDSIDPTEFYLKLQNEYLNIYQDDYDMEIRAIGSIGYKITDQNKLEFGLDNRFSSLFKGSLQSRTWISLGWFLVL